MVKSLFAGCTNNFSVRSFTTGGVQAYFPFSPPLNSQEVSSGTEANAAQGYWQAGTMSKLWITVVNGTSSGTTTVIMRDNNFSGGNGAETFTVAAATTGTFSDTTHSDSIATGDLVDVGVTSGDSNINIDTFTALFDSSGSNTFLKVGASLRNSGAPGGGTTCYQAPGGTNYNTTETLTKTRQRYALTGSGLAAMIVTQGTASGTTFRTRRNAANGGQSVVNSGTGMIRDSSGTDSIAVADDFNFQIPTTGTAPSWATVSTDLASSAGVTAFIATVGGSSAFSVSQGATQNFPITGDLNSPPSGETNCQMPTQVAFTFSQLTVGLSANTVSASSTLKLRANAANPSSGPSVTIGASSGSGTTSDTTNTYVAATSDLVNYQIVAGSGSGTMSVFNLGVWGTAQTGTLFTRSVSDTSSGTITETLPKKAVKPGVGMTISYSEAAAKKAIHAISEPTLSFSESLVVYKIVIAIIDSLVKKAIKPLAESVTASESLAFLKIPAHQLYTRTISESITVSETLKKKAVHGISQALGSVTETLVKKAKHVISESAISVSETLKKLAKHGISQALGSITETLPKKAIKPIAQSVIVSETLVKKAKHGISESLGSVTETLKKKGIKPIAQSSITVSETVAKKAIHAISQSLGTVSETLVKKAIKPISQGLGSVTETIQKKAIHPIAQSITVSETIARSRKQFKTISENLGSVTETLPKKAIKPISQALGSITDALSRGPTIFHRPISESLGSVTELTQKKAVHLVSQSVSTSETLVKKAIKSIHDTPSILVSETIARTKKLFRTISDTSSATITETVKKFAKHLIAEAPSYSESLTATKTFFGGPKVRAIAENLGSITETIQKKAILKISQSITVSETVQKSAKRVVPISQSITYTEALVKKAKHAFSESITPSESLASLRTLAPRLISENLGLISETIKKKAIHPISQGLGSITETLVKKAKHPISQPSLTVSETLQKSAIKKIVETTINVSETIKKKTSKFLTEATITISETIIRKPGRKLSEPVLTVSEILVRSTILRFRSISETITPLSESVKKKTSKSIIEVTAVVVSEIILKKAKHVISEPITYLEALVIHKRFRRAISEPVLGCSEFITKHHKFVIKIFDSLGGLIGAGFGRLHRDLGGSRRVSIHRNPTR